MLIIDVIIIFTIHQSWNISMQRYIPLKDHIYKVNYDTAIGYLRLDEAIAGDNTIDISKYVLVRFKKSLDDTLKYIDNSKIDFYQTGHIEDKEILSKLEYIAKPLLFNISELAKLRWSGYQKSKTNRDINKQFERQFYYLQNKIEEINLLIVKRVIDEFEDRYVYFIIIISLFILLNALVFYVLFITIHKIKQTEKAFIEQKDILTYQANYDSLTGLPNRELFLDRLSQAVISSQREAKLTALLFIDLDRFKEINDSLGHLVGDKVLKIVSSRLQQQIRKTDTLARLGGDEFIIIFSSIKDVNNIIDFVSDLIDEMNKPIMINGHKLYATISVGISIYPNDGDSTEILLKNADAAMFKAKKEGRNTYCFYTEEMTEKAINRIILENKIREALKKEEFIVYYQPQIDGQTDQMIGMEALIRWDDKKLGIISPANFIPLAEDTGLIIDLDLWTMKKAMKQMVQWYSENLNPGVLSLNLSIKQLRQENFIELLKRSLKETGCNPKWIELEVTEGQIMIDPSKSISILHQIRDMGIELAIDDFGTGYSSLSYLKKLPVDKLKIDQSFVKYLPDSIADVAIAKSVISLSQNLNIKVIAEGVETEQQRDFLVRNGCRNIQGYFYSKPMPAQDMDKYLKKSKPV